jgi:hypothetical protein
VSHYKPDSIMVSDPSAVKKEKETLELQYLGQITAQ